MSTEVFCIRNLVFHYNPVKNSSGSRPVLNIPCLDFIKDRITVIRGHNGSGKTTLLKLMNGLYEPASGSIQTNGSRSVLVQQEPYLFHGSVSHNLTAPLRFRKEQVRNSNERVSSTLSMVGLEGFEKRRARELSGGEKKRIAIARALMTEPDVLLLDEPDANIDSATAGELEELFKTLKKQGITIILCSHNKGFAYRCCDHIIDLYQGTPVEHDENIFEGNYLYQQGVLSWFQTSGWTFYCPTLQGNFTKAVISPESFTFVPQDTAETGRNIIKARILSIYPRKKGLNTVTLKGPVEIRMRISDAELTLSKLNVGDEIRLLFEPSSVKLY